MRTVAYHGPGDVRIEDVPAPNPPGVGELTVRVLACGICGMDSSEYLHGPHHVPLTKRHPHSGHMGPLVLGHQFMGSVVAMGPETPGFEVGQRVATGAGIWGGTCNWCSVRRTNLCAKYFTLGLQAPGGLAELASVPAYLSSRTQLLGRSATFGSSGTRSTTAETHAARGARRSQTAGHS
jgi:(R,R)-butanediol dehydrogenase/meso-butanediol dehydrogenase/diacetyl reductase